MLQFSNTGVATQHPLYVKFAPIWKRVRDVVAGQDCIHAAGALYLPMLKGQSQDDYNAYKLRALFYNATWRTMAGLLGMLFRKEPQVEASEALKKLFEDVNLKNTPLNLLAVQVCSEVMQVYRCGLLVDMPLKTANVETQSDAEENNMRPTLQLYKTEDIINWKYGSINNKTQLTLVVLTEETPVAVDPATRQPPNQFEHKTETLYRVLDIDTAFGNVYRVRMMRRNANTGRDEVISTVYPTNNGKLFKHIPFFFLGVDGDCKDPEEPPMIDLVDLNLSHYRTTADYEHGCHLTGLPMPYGVGISDRIDPVTGRAVPTEFYLGSEKAFVTSNPNAKLDYLEFSGQGLTALENNLDRKQQQMAILGARMLAEEKKQAETATTTAIHRTGENAVLSSISINVSRLMTQALEIFAEWAQDSTKVDYKINREFLPFPVDAPMLTALVAAWQAEAYPLDELFDVLQRGDVVDSEMTFEEFMASIKKNLPPGPKVDPNKIDPATGKPFEKPAGDNKQPGGNS